MAAARTWTATGLFVSRFVYTTCYTISYGVVFPSVLLARAVPVNNAAVRGLIEGAQAARHKVDELYHPALVPLDGLPFAGPRAGLRPRRRLDRTSRPLRPSRTEAIRKGVLRCTR